ncbi:MAG: dihydropteroate synthase [Desulfobacterium sp.]|jgi:dihydropteroate synthase|nr:dihydropteroate synthase [Desulfobacterium sp.]
MVKPVDKSMLKSIKWKRFELDFKRKPYIMGILNTTPDSFSDGGRYQSLDKAVEHGLALVEAGADILDIGGESTRPFAVDVTAQEEMDRVVPVIEALSKKIDVPISIDTIKARVAQEAVRAGAAIINDISAMEHDPDMVNVVSKAQLPVILMHMKGTPSTMQIDPTYEDLLGEITIYLAARVKVALEAGIDKSMIILDPGIGFGKTVEHNLMLIQHIDKIGALGYPVLMGPSRKTFVRKILSHVTERRVKADDPEAELGTMAASAACLMNGAQIVRLHDVKTFAPMARIIAAISGYDHCQQD